MANPNPSPETRFKPGCVGNPGGKTSEHKRIEQEAALMSARLRHMQLSLMMERVEAGESVGDLIDSNALKLFKDSEDRAHGTPQQAVDMTTNGDKVSMPSTIILKAASDPSDD